MYRKQINVLLEEGIDRKIWYNRARYVKGIFRRQKDVDFSTQLVKGRIS